MLKVVVGHSEDVLTTEAAKEVIEQIQKDLGGLLPQAGILFCSVELDHQLLLSSICAAFPDMDLVGCTTDGEMSSALGFTDDSLTLMVFASDTIEIHAGVGREATSRGEEAGREAATAAQAGLCRFADEQRFAIILSDPFNAGISDIDKGIKQVLGNNFPVIGGASAAHSKQRQTFQFYNNEVLTDSVVLLLFAGKVAFSYGMMGGHSPMGSKELVTKSENNVLYRIGDKPAIEYFQKYIGKLDLFMNYCIAVYEKDRSGFYVRSAPACDREKGSVTLNGRITEGAMVQIGTADRENLIHSCSEAVSRAVDSYPGVKPAAALLFSCAGRKMIMGSQVVQEVQTVQSKLADIPFAGFYCYGEFGPLEQGGPYMFHGTTFITLLLGPSEEE